MCVRARACGCVRVCVWVHLSSREDVWHAVLTRTSPALYLTYLRQATKHDRHRLYLCAIAAVALPTDVGE